jgi:hypothetical protein
VEGGVPNGMNWVAHETSILSGRKLRGHSREERKAAETGVELRLSEISSPSGAGFTAWDCAPTVT